MLKKRNDLPYFGHFGDSSQRYVALSEFSLAGRAAFSVSFSPVDFVARDAANASLTRGGNQGASLGNAGAGWPSARSAARFASATSELYLAGARPAGSRNRSWFARARQNRRRCWRWIGSAERQRARRAHARLGRLRALAREGAAPRRRGFFAVTETRLRRRAAETSPSAQGLTRTAAEAANRAQSKTRFCRLAVLPIDFCG